MTISTFKKLCSDKGEHNLIGIHFNNNLSTYFLKEKFDLDNNLLKMDSGEEYIVLKSKFSNKKTGRNDIPITIIKPMEAIEGVIFADNGEDINNIDKSLLHIR